ncbi:hypothetical protein GCM10020255_096360 [Rhodococcus baikonurensis]
MPGEFGHRLLGLGGDLRCIGRTGAQHELNLRIEVVCCCDEVPDALLSRDPPDKGHDGFRRVDADRRECGLRSRCRSTGMPNLGVDSVAYDVHATRIDSGVRVEDVESHTGTDGDDRVCVLDGVAFGPRRDPIATT